MNILENFIIALGISAKIENVNSSISENPRVQLYPFSNTSFRGYVKRPVAQ